MAWAIRRIEAWNRYSPSLDKSILLDPDPRFPFPPPMVALLAVPERIIACDTTAAEGDLPGSESSLKLFVKYGQPV